MRPPPRRRRENARHLVEGVLRYGSRCRAHHAEHDQAGERPRAPARAGQVAVPQRALGGSRGGEVGDDGQPRLDAPGRSNAVRTQPRGSEPPDTARARQFMTPDSRRETWDGSSPHGAAVERVGPVVKGMSVAGLSLRRNTAGTGRVTSPAVADATSRNREVAAGPKQHASQTIRPRFHDDAQLETARKAAPTEWVTC